MEPDGEFEAGVGLRLRRRARPRAARELLPCHMQRFAAYWLAVSTIFLHIAVVEGA
jgi:hypothetical protein